MGASKLPTPTFAVARLLAKIETLLVSAICQKPLEGKRMASGRTGNAVPRKGLRVRLPCPPLK